MELPTAIATLGLPVWPVREDELRSAWRHFARSNHPDRCPGDGGAPARFDLGRRAYEALREEIHTQSPPARVHRSTWSRTVRGPEAAMASPHRFEPLSTRQWRA